MKIAIVGGPSLGKTVLSMEVTAALKKKHYDATFVGEYARTWMSKHKKAPTCAEDQAFIMRGQRKRELEAENTQEIVVTDSTTWMCAVYATPFLRGPDNLINVSSNVTVNDLFEDCVPESDSYDLVFLLPRCFKMKKEKGRVQSTEGACIHWDNKIIAFASLFELPVITLSKTPTSWLQEILDVVLAKLEASHSTIV